MNTKTLSALFGTIGKGAAYVTGAVSIYLGALPSGTNLSDRHVVLGAVAAGTVATLGYLSTTHATYKGIKDSADAVIGVAASLPLPAKVQFIGTAAQAIQQVEANIDAARATPAPSVGETEAS